MTLYFIPYLLNDYGIKYFGQLSPEPSNKFLNAILSLGLSLLAAFLASGIWGSLGWSLVLVALWGVIRIDGKYQVIPDRLHMIGALGCCFIISQGTTPYSQVLEKALFGILMIAGLWGFTKLYELIRKETALGFGDIKLFAWLAILVGTDIPFLVFVSLLVGCLGILPLMLFGRKQWLDRFAFGPCIVIAFLFIEVIHGTVSY
jgi:prepilin signal peptidase PulO-like enzyme (type II secretory pathway)